jgi:plastocyanin
MRHARIIGLVAVLAIALTVAATAALAATSRVGVRKAGNGFRFTPAALTLKRGDTVTWSWRGNVAHNVTGPGFHSRTAPALTFSRRFTRPGTFRVICSIHVSLGQRMTITVR